MALTFGLLCSFFVLALIVRSVIKLNICALCVAVSGTWIVLLVRYTLTGTSDPVAIGILLGGSAVGGMYYISARLPERFHILKFPFLITAFWIIYRILQIPSGGNINKEIITLLTLWLVFGIVFAAHKKKSRLRGIAKTLIACCREW